ncbi:MAG: signal peptidase I [Pseudomonadota bacterium]
MTRLQKLLRSEFVQLVALLLLISAARSSFADHYHVPTGSMEYTLMPGDRVFVDKSAYGLRIPFTKIDVVKTGAPQAGDVAVFDSPENGTLLIKRIVAVGGDHVRLSDGSLWLNGQRLSLPTTATVERFSERVVQLNLTHGGGPDINGFTVPERSVLAIGDHRGNSHDSRYFGLIDTRELYGRAVAIYYSSGEGFQWTAL